MAVGIKRLENHKIRKENGWCRKKLEGEKGINTYKEINGGRRRNAGGESKLYGIYIYFVGARFSNNFA